MSTLDRRNAISQTKGNTLRLGADANVSSQFAIVLLFYRHIDQGIFSEHTNKVHQDRKTSKQCIGEGQGVVSTIGYFE